MSASLNAHWNLLQMLLSSLAAHILLRMACILLEGKPCFAISMAMLISPLVYNCTKLQAKCKVSPKPLVAVRSMATQQSLCSAPSATLQTGDRGCTPGRCKPRALKHPTSRRPGISCKICCRGAARPQNTTASVPQSTACHSRWMWGSLAMSISVKMPLPARPATSASEAPYMRSHEKSNECCSIDRHSCMPLHRYNGCDRWTENAGLDCVINIDTGSAAPEELASHIEASLLHHSIEGTAL